MSVMECSLLLQVCVPWTTSKYIFFPSFKLNTLNPYELSKTSGTNTPKPKGSDCAFERLFIRKNLVTLAFKVLDNGVSILMKGKLINK